MILIWSPKIPSGITVLLNRVLFIHLHLHTLHVYQLCLSLALRPTGVSQLYSKKDQQEILPITQEAVTALAFVTSTGYQYHEEANTE